MRGCHWNPGCYNMKKRKGSKHSRKCQVCDKNMQESTTHSSIRCSSNKKTYIQFQNMHWFRTWCSDKLQGDPARNRAKPKAHVSRQSTPSRSSTQSRGVWTYRFSHLPDFFKAFRSFFKTFNRPSTRIRSSFLRVSPDFLLRALSSFLSSSMLFPLKCSTWTISCLLHDAPVSKSQVFSSTPRNFNMAALGRIWDCVAVQRCKMFKKEIQKRNAHGCSANSPAHSMFVA